MFDPRLCECPLNTKLNQTSSWVLPFIHWREGVSSRATLTGLTIRMPWKSTWPRANIGLVNPQYQHRLEYEWVERILAKKDLGYWWMKSWARPSNVCLQPRKPTAFWAASKAAWSAGRRRFSLSALVRFHLMCLGSQWHERHGSLGASPEKGHRIDQTDETSLLRRTVKEKNCGCSAPNKKAPEKLFRGLSVYNGGLQGRRRQANFYQSL